MGHSYTPEEEAILRRHVTDLEGDVYAIFNLPQEVVAVIFAYVSRSPRSFRDNLLKLVLSGDLDMGDLVDLYDSRDVDLTAAQEKARDFHRRVTIGYGHSSVAELASVSIGVENISRLASAELELSNRWLSFIEYSQRYQRPARGRYVTPPELAGGDREDLLEAYRRLQDHTFDVYERLLQGLLPWLEAHVPRREGESDRRFRTRIEKIAFEDARYALTLGVQTNLGMTGNARAVRDAAVRLLSAPHGESRRLGEGIRREASKLLPSLIRYAEASPYQEAFHHRFGPGGSAALALTGATGAGPHRESGRRVRLLDWTGRAGKGTTEVPAAAIAEDPAGYLRPYHPDGNPEDQHRALARVLAAAFALGGTPVSENDLLARGPDRLLDLYADLLQDLGPHDHPADALKQVHYLFEISISEANWHQFLRHCRQIDFAPAAPDVAGGWTVPPNVAAAGLEDVLREAVEAAESVFHSLSSLSPQAAHYAVTNAHHRYMTAVVSLWEMFHLINLRGKPDTQWDIRQTVFALRDLVRRVHPHLLEVSRPARV